MSVRQPELPLARRSDDALSKAPGDVTLIACVCVASIWHVTSMCLHEWKKTDTSQRRAGARHSAHS